MHKELQPNSDVDGLYVSRRLYIRGLVICESTIMSEENNLGWYLKNSKFASRSAACQDSEVQRMSHRKTLKNR